MDKQPTSSNIVACVAVPGRVSIVIPAYNNGATIAATIESCLAQTYHDVEIIVINDGSNDNTAAILDSFGTKITAIHQQNGGIANARNASVMAASGEFIAWMDADDLAESNRITTQQQILARYDDIALVSSSFSAFSADHNILKPNYELTYYSAPSQLGGLEKIYPYLLSASDSAMSVRTGDCRKPLLQGNFVHPPTVMVRRDAFEKIGFFDTTLLYSSDYDWLLRASRVGHFAFIGHSLLRYRISAEQISHKASAKIPLETIRIIKKTLTTDPAIAYQYARLLKIKIAECWLDAAESAVKSSRISALQYWAHSAITRPANARLIRILGKIIVPKFAVKTVKKAVAYFSLRR